MSESMRTHGDFGWRDLMTDDVDSACAFYTDVIGWSTEVMDIGKGPYTVFKIGDRPVAGLMGKGPSHARCTDSVDKLRHGRRCRHARRQGR